MACVSALAAASPSRDLRAAGLAIAAGWLAGVAFWAVAPYGAFWGFLFVQLSLIAYFYWRLRLPASASPSLTPPKRRRAQPTAVYEILFWLHVARLLLTAVGPFLLPPYWLMFALNRLFEAGLLVLAASSAAAIVFSRRPEVKERALRALDKWARVARVARFMRL